MSVPAGKANCDTKARSAEAIGARIRKIRTALKLTQAQFIVPLRISASHFSETESGKNPPSGLLLVAISRCYHVNMQFLESGTGEMFNRSREAFSDLDGIVRYYPEFRGNPDSSHSFLRIPGAAETHFVVQAHDVKGLAVEGDHILLAPFSEKDLNDRTILFLADKLHRQYVYKVTMIDGQPHLDLSIPNVSAMKLQRSRYTAVFKVVAIYRTVRMPEANPAFAL